MDPKQKAALLTGRESRNQADPQFECRDADGALTIAGYACRTGISYPMGFYDETVARGAFTKTLAERPDVQLLANHTGFPYARTTNGTLDLEEDDKGLHFVGRMDSSDPDAQALANRIKSGLLDQCSFSFMATRSDWNEPDFTERTIRECNISRADVGPVNYGANPATTVSMRSVAEFLSAMEAPEMESLLRSLKVEPPKPKPDEPKLVSLMDLLRAADPEQLAEARTLLLPPPPVVEPPKGLPLDVAQGIAFSIKARSAA